MTNAIASLEAEYGAIIAALAGALAAGDAPRLMEELDALVARRERSLFGELRKLTTDLQQKKASFGIRQEVVLWNPLALLLFVGLITAEWLVRKFSNLS